MCMSCYCRECRHEWFQSSMSRRCPMCGSCDTVLRYDEQGIVTNWDYEEDDEDLYDW